MSNKPQIQALSKELFTLETESVPESVQYMNLFSSIKCEGKRNPRYLDRSFEWFYCISYNDETNASHCCLKKYKNINKKISVWEAPISKNVHW